MIREEIYDGILANDIIGFHTRSYRRNFLQCCEDLFGYKVDHQGGVVRCGDREVWVRAYPLPIDSGAVQAVARRDRTRRFEDELLRRRRDHLILRVDRADLSKNVLRGFGAFDVFLDQHPEFREKVTFIAQLMPSRTDVPEYAEYLERIEAVVAVVNHRHGTTDWMPIQLKLRDDLEEAVAAYKHYDVLMVNAMFDGMNLVAKEGPMVNERAGVSILSENTGAHEELGEYALSVNPFDLQELADSIHAALTMPVHERERRHEGLKSIVTARDPGDWIDDQLADIRRKGDSEPRWTPRSVECGPRTRTALAALSRRSRGGGGGWRLAQSAHCPASRAGVGFETPGRPASLTVACDLPTMHDFVPPVRPRPDGAQTGFSSSGDSQARCYSRPPPVTGISPWPRNRPFTISCCSLSESSTDDERAKILAEVEAAIASSGGSIERNQDWGRRPLTYQHQPPGRGGISPAAVPGADRPAGLAVTQPAHRRRGSALSHHQGDPGHTSGAGFRTSAGGPCRRSGPRHRPSVTAVRHRRAGDRRTGDRRALRRTLAGSAPVVLAAPEDDSES